MRDDLRAKRYDNGYMKGWRVAAAMVREDYANQGRPAVRVPVHRSEAPSVPSLSVAGLAVGIVALLIIGGLIFALFARRPGVAGGSSVLVLPTYDDDDDERRRRRDDDSTSSFFSSGSPGDSGSTDSGGDFGGGGGFDGGGSSDSI